MQTIAEEKSGTVCNDSAMVTIDLSTVLQDEELSPEVKLCVCVGNDTLSQCRHHLLQFP